jgi:3-phytase
MVQKASSILNKLNADLNTSFFQGHKRNIQKVLSKYSMHHRSNRSDNSIDWYLIEQDTLLFLHKTPSEALEEVYGFCLYRSPKDGHFYAFVNDKTGLVEQYRISETAEGLQTQRVRKLKAPSQVEGMVVDRDSALLYVGVEEAGILCFGAEPDASTKGRLIEGSTADNPALAYDIEGLTLYHGPQGSGYLLASSQGNHSYAVFQRQAPNQYLGSFHIGTKAEATKDTDGIDVVEKALGDAFPQGVFVCQDGFNYEQNQHIPQNFKLVPWEAIRERIAGGLQ